MSGARVVQGVLRSLAAVCVMVLLLAQPSRVHSSAQLRDAVTETLTATDGTRFAVTRAMVRVPEQRTASVAEPAKTIDLAVVRVRRVGAPGSSRATGSSTASSSSSVASSPAPPSSPAHIILAGGPGDSGVDQVLGLARQGGALFADLVAGDVIGIDQRGTGRSIPNLTSSTLYPLPLEQPASAEAWLPIIERTSRAEAARFRAKGITLEAYNTRESADDVDAVRAALDYTRVTLWGRSYGTHLALATLARHPAMVDRLVLVSPEGLDHTWKLPSAVDAVLERLEGRGAGDLIEPLRAVIARLRTTPVPVDAVHPLTGTPARIVLGPLDIQMVVARVLGDPRLLVTLPPAVREMHDGDFRRIAQIAILQRERAGVQSAMKMMMDLSSGASEARLARIEREAATAVLGNAINFPAMHLANAWGAVDLGPAYRQPVRSNVPALLLVGDLDPRTPVANATEIAAALPRASVVTLENATHQFDLFGSAPIRQVLAQFLRGDDVAVTTLALPPIPFVAGRPRESFRPLKGNNSLHFAR